VAVSAPEKEAPAHRKLGRGTPRSRWIVSALIVFGVSAAVLILRTHTIETERRALARGASQGPRVLVKRVGRAPGSEDIRLPASVHGFVETGIYAKIAGYAKEIRVDKGDRVRKGEVLLVLESPELDKQVVDARANYWLQRVTDDRYQRLVKEDAVARQSADTSHAQMLQAKATYEQLLALQRYEIITAPVDGLITARYLDPGALVPQATSPVAGSTPILAIATMKPVRVYADVPQDLSPYIRDGAPAVVTASQYPGRRFEGTVTRHPEALASDTRTMRVEVDLDNSDSALYPGMYATMELHVSSGGGVPLVPDDALVFRDGKVYVPVVENNRIRLAAVTLGLDNGREVEITQGVSENDWVAINLGQAVRDGDPVQPIEAKE
jgi:membrane fusion protein, multidrug efflux system